MDRVRQTLTGRISRFTVVGVSNAVVSFGLLNICFYLLHTDKIVSSIIATTCAVIFSFLLNRNFVFLDKSKRAHHQILPFVLVTISGSLVVLNIIYASAVAMLNHHDMWLVHLIHNLTGLTLARTFVDINVSTVIGALVAMVWNYNGYRLLVFKGAPHPQGVGRHEVQTAGS